MSLWIERVVNVPLQSQYFQPTSVLYILHLNRRTRIPTVQSKSVELTRFLTEDRHERRFHWNSKAHLASTMTATSRLSSNSKAFDWRKLAETWSCNQSYSDNLLSIIEVGVLTTFDKGDLHQDPIRQRCSRQHTITDRCDCGGTEPVLTLSRTSVIDSATWSKKRKL